MSDCDYQQPSICFTLISLDLKCLVDGNIKKLQLAGKTSGNQSQMGLHFFISLWRKNTEIQRIVAPRLLKNCGQGVALWQSFLIFMESFFYKIGNLYQQQLVSLSKPYSAPISGTSGTYCKLSIGYIHCYYATPFSHRIQYAMIYLPHTHLPYD